MIEKVYFVYSDYGFIGTIASLNKNGKNYVLIDIYGIFTTDGNIYFESEIHRKYTLTDEQMADILDTVLPEVISNYTKNEMHYFLSQPLNPNDFFPR